MSIYDMINGWLIPPLGLLGVYVFLIYMADKNEDAIAATNMMALIGILLILGAILGSL